MNKILCPVDFSDASLNAVEFATRIAEQHKATLTLIHVFTEQEFGEALSKGAFQARYKQSDIDNLLGAAEEMLKSMADEIYRISKSRGMQACDYHFTYGPLERQITQFANEHHYKLIVMGTTGVVDVMEKYIGSNTVRTISRAHCPVMCVPTAAAYRKIKKIAFASDYQEEDKNVLNELVSFAMVTEAEIHVVHVAQQDNDMEEAMYREFEDTTRTYLDYPLLKFSVEYNPDPSHGLDSYVLREKCDLLAVLYQRKNFFQKLLDESTTKDITYFASYPVMVFKEVDV
ncbi:MAG: universal stress protein [Cyclobacteriaceae bacterium]